VERILLTGGAGFLGSAVALRLAQAFPAASVVVIDNLRRRGSELNLPRLQAHGIRFMHADVRNASDLDIGPIDLIVECSAEPSVMAGRDGDARYVLDTNLGGALNCLELARQHRAALVFVSSSRIYPFDRLLNLPLDVVGQRFALRPGAALPAGLSAAGITTEFALPGRRTLYGASKLAAELIIQEYADVYGIPAIILRLGVIAGPWQMGKVDQGFVALWVARHLANQALHYIGFDGMGHQVRDIVHVQDVCDLILATLPHLSTLQGDVYNAGGGPDGAVSLREATALCEDITGRAIPIGSNPQTRPGDIPWYVTDNTDVTSAFGWAPSRSVRDIITDTAAWLTVNPVILDTIFG
jgi:CDP-paratose 2-epimerase